MQTETFNPFILIIFLGTLFAPRSVNGHIDTPCQHLAVHNFTPCFNLATGSSVNGSNPSTECCHELNKLSHSDIDCACLVLLGTIPAQFTFLRSLQAVLPPSCNVSGVPLQCKGYGAPLPAPGPSMSAPENSPASPASSRTGLAPTTHEGAEAQRHGGEHIQPLLNPPASKAHGSSKSGVVFMLWCLIVIASGLWPY